MGQEEYKAPPLSMDKGFPAFNLSNFTKKNAPIRELAGKACALTLQPYLRMKSD